MEIQQKKIGDIKPYHKNSKKHPKYQVEQVATSIKEFGFNQPIVIDKEGIIIVGHGRLLAAAYLGLEEVPTITLDLSEEQAKAYRLADNKLNESEWEMDLVIEELKGLSAPMIDLTGFSHDLILEADDKDDEIPEPPSDPISKLGDFYELGRHKLLCGDAREIAQVDLLRGGALADMVFTDPPYNVDYEGMQNSKQWDKIANDKMAPEEFQAFLEQIFKNYHEVTKKEAALYICHADKSHKEFRNAFEKAGYAWRATIIWVKNSPAFNFAQYKYKHEPIFYCFKENAKVNWYGDRMQNTIWEAKKEKGLHPTIKPVELIVKAISNSSQEDDIVMDLFGGSGSTLIAAEKTNRICQMMEIEPKYVDVIVSRYVAFTGNNIIKKNGEEIEWKNEQKEPTTEEEGD